MDDHNVHHFWGGSAGIDLLQTPGLHLETSGEPLRLLQVAAAFPFSPLARPYQSHTDPAPADMPL